ncbi:hypothetical protein ACLK1Y_13810 [Escherichia coli]
METWRGCDQVEVAVSWQQAIERQDGPSALVLTLASRLNSRLAARNNLAILRVAVMCWSTATVNLS